MKTGFRVDMNYGLRLADSYSRQEIQKGWARQTETMSDGDGYVDISDTHLQQ